MLLCQREEKAAHNSESIGTSDDISWSIVLHRVSDYHRIGVVCLTLASLPGLTVALGPINNLIDSLITSWSMPTAGIQLVTEGSSRPA